jgi:hypothetical protein
LLLALNIIDGRKVERLDRKKQTADFYSYQWSRFSPVRKNPKMGISPQAGLSIPLRFRMLFTSMLRRVILIQLKLDTWSKRWKLKIRNRVLPTVHSDTQGVSTTTMMIAYIFKTTAGFFKNHSTTKKAGQHRGQAGPADWNRIDTRRKASKTCPIADACESLTHAILSKAIPKSLVYSSRLRII